MAEKENDSGERKKYESNKDESYILQEMKARGRGAVEHDEEKRTMNQFSTVGKGYQNYTARTIAWARKKLFKVKAFEEDKAKFKIVKGHFWAFWSMYNAWLPVDVDDVTLIEVVDRITHTRWHNIDKD